MSWPPQEPGALKPVCNHYCPLSVHCEAPRFWWWWWLYCLYFCLLFASWPEPPSSQSSTATHTFLCLCNRADLLVISSSPHSASAPLWPAGPAVLSPSVCCRFRNTFAFISILPVDLHHNLFLVCTESYQRAWAVQTLLLCGFVVCRGRNKIGQSEIQIVVLVTPELSHWFKYFSTLSVCESRKWVKFPTWRNYTIKSNGASRLLRSQWRNHFHGADRNTNKHCALL